MKKNIIVYILLLVAATSFAQPGKKTPVKQKAPSQTEMDQAMEEAMKGMSKEEKEEMRKMMKEVMPKMATKPGAPSIAFTDNKRLIPAKDLPRINRIPKTIFTNADIGANTTLLYNKLQAKIKPAEKTILATVLAKAKNSADLMEAAITCFMQGHSHAAIGLALKAVLAEPKNITYQNNLAAILSQSGYPEKAIPYLKKLSSQYPSNSTVLHNLGYAWLALGEVDTARRFFAYAAVRNPNNPETKLCRGIIEESKGDPKKAAEHYVESFEEAANPFTEMMATNVHAQSRLQQLDFEKLKKRIAIYEYFKKDWIKIPQLEDHVGAYEKNRSIQNGYSKMFDELTAKIEAMEEASGAELEALFNQGETAFIETMANENIKGINMMSMPAVYVLKILMAYYRKWIEEFPTESAELMRGINEQKIIITKAGKNDQCADYDRKNNQFLAYANPLIRKFYAKKIEEFRVWVNAYCTWSWYLTGNPKNTVLSACITWTGAITEIYKSAIADQFVFSKSCAAQNGDGITPISVPAIPNFTCPAVVSLPVGMDELQLSADVANFDNNQWNIKQAPGATIPNITLSLGVGNNEITEPGKYGNPYAKTGNGTVITSGIGINEPITPLNKITDDLMPLTKLPLDELTPLQPALLDIDKKLTKNDYKKVRQADITKQILKEMMKTKCPGTLPVKKKRKDNFWVGLGELELLPLEVLELEPIDLGVIGQDPVTEVGIGELELWDDEMQAWITEKGGKRYEEGFKEKLIAEVKEALKTSGIQTTISNGLDGLRTMNSVDRSLFD